MSDDLRVWHAIFREDSRPVACASFGLYRTDLAALATPRVQTILNGLRSVAPKFAYMNMLFCGLPVSIGQSSIGLAAGCDVSRLVKSLETLMSELGRGHMARLLVAKEFTEQECEALDLLRRHGYHRAQAPNQYVMRRRHASFSEYRKALKSDYRRNIDRSLKKFAASGLQVERIERGKCIAEVYTDDLHMLYWAVRAALNSKEVLPGTRVPVSENSAGNTSSEVCR